MLRPEPGELPRSGARPSPASPGGEGGHRPEGKGLYWGHGTASALGREQRVAAWKGAACSPLCPTMHRQNAEQTPSPCSTFSLLRGKGEAIRWKAPQPLRLCSPPVPPAEPPGHANALAHGQKLNLPPPGSREIPAGGVLGTPSHGLPEHQAPQALGSLPGDWGAAQPAAGGQQSCAHLCQSQLQFEPRGPAAGRGAVRGLTAQQLPRSQESIAPRRALGQQPGDRSWGGWCGPR